MENKRLLVNMPDSSKENNDTDYLLSLVKKTGLSWRELERRTGVNRGTLKKMIDPKYFIKCPYAVQYILEILATQPENNGD